VSGVSCGVRASEGPYRPSRDPQVLLLVVIVVAVVGLWVVGAMSPATLVGGDGGPVFPFRDQSEDGQIEVAVNASTVDPGGTVAVTVTVDDDPVGDAPVAVDGRTYATDSDGRVVVRLDAPGEVDVTATTPDGNRSTSTTVRVRRYETDLVVDVPTSTETGQRVPVRVTLANGTPVSAVVTAGGERVRTGADGVANVSFETAGPVTVSASKASTERYRFADATATIDVDRRTVALAVSTNASQPRVDDRVSVTVVRRDTGEPVNATVAWRNESIVTGADGRATVRFARGGRVDLAATAPRTAAVTFASGEERVDVRRIAVGLSVTVSPSVVEEGDRATFVVRRADTGERVPATVTLYGTAYPTGADGRVSFPFSVPGNVSVTASKASSARERFVDANTSFVVTGPELAVESLAVPATARADATMNVTATVSNVGTVDYDGPVVVAVGTETTQLSTTVAAGGDPTSVTWRVATPNTTGTVTVTVQVEEVRITREVALQNGSDVAGNATDAATSPWRVDGRWLRTGLSTVASDGAFSRSDSRGRTARLRRQPPVDRTTTRQRPHS
jgi:hypothetical protein